MSVSADSKEQVNSQFTYVHTSAPKLNLELIPGRFQKNPIKSNQEKFTKVFTISVGRCYSPQLLLK